MTTTKKKAKKVTDETAEERKARKKAEDAAEDARIRAMWARQAETNKMLKAQMRRILGEILTGEVTRKGVTLYSAIRQSGLTQTTGRSIFGGESMPQVDTLLAIEAGLGVPAGWVMAQLDARWRAWLAEYDRRPRTPAEMAE